MPQMTEYERLENAEDNIRKLYELVQLLTDRVQANVDNIGLIVGILGGRSNAKEDTVS